MIADETMVGFLQRVLKPEVVHPPNADNSVTLIEDDPNVLMEIAVSAIEEPFIVVRPQQMGHLACTAGERIRWVCDYLIILHCGNGCNAVFLELKKTFEYLTKAPEQLRRSLPLLRYLEALYAVESQKTSEPAKVAYAVVYEKSRRFNKQSTRPVPYPEMVKHEQIDVAALMGRRVLRIADLFRSPRSP